MIDQAAHKPTYQELEAEVIRLKAELAQLRRLIFGQKSERFVPDQNADQLSLDVLDTTTASTSPAKTETITYTRKKAATSNVTPHSRNVLPDSLPRVDVVIEPEQDVTGLKKIGEEITEELEYKPGKLFVKRFIRPKYARRGGDGVVIAHLPSRPIDKGIPGPTLLSHIVISKYVDHLPLYRQQQQFKRLGLVIPESTLCGWIKSTADLIKPLVEMQFDLIKRTSYLMADETPIRVLDRNKKGRSHLGYYWVYYSPLEKIVCFDYRPGRGRDGPTEILQSFKGSLQFDGWQAYNSVASRKGVIAVGCMAHARRYFEQALGSDPDRATWMLQRIQELYAVERLAREKSMTFEERYQVRQKNALPVMKEIKTWLDQNVVKVLPKNDMGEAIGYTLGQWPKLERYLNDGRLEIDNNLVENAIRPVAFGRKNYLFASSHESAQRGAVIYSLVATAKLHNLDSSEYLTDVINRIADHPFKKLADLLPQNWKK
jgi:transposase